MVGKVSALVSVWELRSYRSMKRFALFIVPILFLVTIPATTQAASASFFGPIISTECTCPGIQAPGWGCVFDAIQNLMNMGISFACLIMVLVLMYAGFLFMQSATNPETRSKAKSVLINAFIGFVIVLAAWLIVDFFMKTLYGGQFGPWNSILSGGTGSQCIVATPTKSIFTGPSITAKPASGPGSSAAGGAGVVAPGNGASGLNVGAAISWLQAHHKNPPYVGANKLGQCASYVRQAICAGGLKAFCGGGPDASSYGPVLTNNKFTHVYQGTFSGSSASAFAYQPGDVVVFQPVSGHSVGHITMYTGSGWISDFVQSNMSSNFNDYQGGTFDVYRP